MSHTPFAPIFSLFVLMPFIIYIGIIVFSIFFAVKVIKFMNTKTKLDQDRNEKLDELIKILKKNDY